MKIELRFSNEKVIPLWEQDDLDEYILGLAIGVLKGVYEFMSAVEYNHGNTLTLWIDEREAMHEQILCVEGLAEFLRGD